MRRAIVLFIAPTTALTLAACIISTDGLSGGTSTPDSSSPLPGSEGGVVTPGNEAGSPLEEAGTADAEAGTGTDAQAPPPFFVSTGTAGWCAGLSPPPKTCLDFDEGSGLDGLTPTQTGGTLTVDSVATSSPHALLAQMTTTNQTGNAFVEVAGSQSPTSVTVQGDVYLDPANGYVEFNSLYLSYGDTSSCALEPAENSGQIVLNEYCAGDVGNLSVNHLVTTVAATGWYTVLFTVDFTTRQFDAWAKKPDGTVGGFAQPLTLNPMIVTGLSREFVGIGYANAANPPTKIRVDNVVFDYH